MKLSTIETGFFHTDGGSMFGLLPKIIWSKYYPCDEKNRCVLSMRSLVVQEADRIVLFDPGCGMMKDKRSAPYGFTGLKNIVEELEKKGIGRDRITDIVLSHLHFDHCGAILSQSPDGSVYETFPNATYHVSLKQLEHAQNPHSLDKDAYFEEHIGFFSDNPKVHLIETDYDLTPDISLRLNDAHTPGQIIGFISDNDKEETFIFAADAIPTALNIRMEAISPYDLCQMVSADEKERLLEKANAEKAVFIFYHDAYTEACKIKKAATSRFLPVKYDLK